MMDDRYDSLDGWRKEVGIRTSKGEVRHYAGGCEYDPTAEAIMEYEREQARKKAAAEAKKAEAKKAEQPKKEKPQEEERCL